MQLLDGIIVTHLAKIITSVASTQKSYDSHFNIPKKEQKVMSSFD